METRSKRLISEIIYNLDNNNLSTAHIGLRNLFKFDPDNIDGIFLEAQLFFLQDDYEKAIIGFDKCLKVFSGNLDLQRRKIYALAKLKDYANAEKLINDFAKRQKLDSELLFILGTCLTRKGDAQGAIKALNSAISFPKHDPLAELSLGHALKADSQVELAERHYRNFIDRTMQKGNGYWSIADLKSGLLNANDRSEMLTYIEKSNDVLDVSLTHFALGKSYEEAKQYNNAFIHWTQANEIQKEVRPFKYKPFHLLVENLRSILEVDIKTDISLKHNTREPIFVVGMPRSGSTLVEQILTSHSMIGATDELPFFEQLDATFERTGGISSNLHKIDIENIQKDYFKSVEHYQETEKKYFIDKNPNNFLHIATIKKVFPDAKIINIIRKPIDNAVSVYRQFFFKGHDFSFSFDSIIEYWHGYIDVMTHWDNVLDKQIYHLSYERLVNNFDQEIIHIMDYLGMEFQSQMSHFYNNKRTVLTPSVSQVTKPLYKSSIGYFDKFSEELADYTDDFNKLDTRLNTFLK